MQRFKASLVTGCWPENPEPLVRDDDGGYVKHDDALRLKMALQTIIDAFDNLAVDERKVYALDFGKNALLDS